MKTHKAYKIDAYSDVITEVKINDYRDIYSNIGCGTFCVATTLPNGDTLYVDDEGYLNQNVTRGFMFKGRFFAGNGLLIGGNKIGESVNVKTKELDVANMVTFMPERFTIPDEMREDAMSGWSVTIG